ncbi:hypothetical protein BASA81_003758 [Batrachochytrium salamandrivorans]|nr:hypothetical protein BASA81_003758 [Batrachochytrium salamandrivorans]
MCLGKELANAIRLFLIVLVLMAYIAAILPASAILSGNPGSGPYQTLGVSVLLAGLGSPPSGSGVQTSQVGWFWLETQDVCRNYTQLYELWAQERGVCAPCDLWDGECFSIPGAVWQQFGVVVASLALASIITVTRTINVLCCGCTYGAPSPPNHW